MRKYLNLEMAMTCVILLYVAILTCDGYFVSKLSARAMSFPRFIFLLAGVIGVLEIIRVKRAVDADEAKPIEKRKKKKPLVEHAGNFWEIVILTVGYFVFMYLIGFFLSSVLFSVIYAYRHKYPRMVQFSVISIAIVFAWYFLFERMLGVTFPEPYLLRLFN